MCFKLCADTFWFPGHFSSLGTFPDIFVEFWTLDQHGRISYFVQTYIIHSVRRFLRSVKSLLRASILSRCYSFRIKSIFEPTTFTFLKVGGCIILKSCIVLFINILWSRLSPSTRLCWFQLDVSYFLIHYTICWLLFDLCRCHWLVQKVVLLLRLLVKRIPQNLNFICWWLG